MDDRCVVAAQLERSPRSPVKVVARCHLGLPVVIAVSPHLDDGTPFPTRYWLTCPLAIRRIGRLEAAGGVRELDDRIEVDPVFAARYARAMESYANERDALIETGRFPHDPTGGVGGSGGGVKCLHAHYAHHASGATNPIGAEAAAAVEPLNCKTTCVVASGTQVTRNPDWREPAR